MPAVDMDGVEGYAEMLEDLEETETNPVFFALHELQNRAYNFQRVIGEGRWRFYRR